jgi:hypothetical protein
VPFLVGVLLIYGVFLIAQHADRTARRAFAARLAAMYRTRGEFWRLYTWATEARARGDAEAGARFRDQAAVLLPAVTGDATALRRDYPALATEIGWMAGLLDDELADMGRAVAWPDRDFDRWVTGRDRPPVEAVINPAPAMDDDALTRRIHVGIGVVLGTAGGFVAWLITYWNDPAGTLVNMAFYILLGAAVLGHIAGAMRHTLWNALAAGIHYRNWWAGPA